MSDESRSKEGWVPQAAGRILEDPQVTEVAIGLEDGPGGRFRTLQRTHATVRQAVHLAGRAAQALAAAEGRGSLLDDRPASIRVSDRPGGACLMLEFDVVGPRRPSRPIRMILMTPRAR